MSIGFVFSGWALSGQKLCGIIFFMDTKIFNQGLSVEAVSAYILICAIGDEGRPISRTAILERWNSSEDDLNQALGVLKNYNVIYLAPHCGELDQIWLLNGFHKWGYSQPWPAPKGLPVFNQE